MSNSIVLDASALLALLFLEPGHELVANYIENHEAVISAVNVSEVLAKQQELRIPLDQALSYLQLLGFRMEAFDAQQALQAASLRALTKKLGLSFGDRACLALAQQYGCPVLTADRAWANADVGVEVVVIR